MLATLLESRPRPARAGARGAAGATSLVIHTLVIALALYATASADPVAPEPVEAVHVIYHATPAPPTPATRPARPAAPTPVPPETPATPMPPMPPVIPIGITTPLQVTLGSEFIGFTGSEPRTPGLAGAPVGAGGGGGEPLTALHVDRAVRLVSGSRPPRYPEQLRRDRVDGSVLVSYVVDSTGRVEQGSVRVLESAHPLFERAVRDALGSMRFVPAEAGGRRVRQLVEQSFLFTLRR